VRARASLPDALDAGATRRQRNVARFRAIRIELTQDVPANKWNPVSRGRHCNVAGGHFNDVTSYIRSVAYKRY
jgi:hypothetical protein